VYEIEQQKDPFLDLLKIIIGSALVLLCAVLLVWHAIFGLEVMKAAKKVHVDDIFNPEKVHPKTVQHKR